MAPRTSRIHFLAFALATLGAAPLGAQGIRPLVPPIQGAYLGWRSDATANPYGGAFRTALGWREKIYVCEGDWTGYNYVGGEFLGQARPHELHVGARMILQPWSFFQTSIAYERIAYPFGLLDVSEGGVTSEDDVWSSWRVDEARWGDAFTWSSSLQKEFGSFQFHLRGDWTRLDIDGSRDDSLYLPIDDIPVRSRDDILRVDGMIGVRVERPLLSAWGLAYNTTASLENDIQRRRVGVWAQAWPFSQRSDGLIRFWHVLGRLDLWLTHEHRAGQPRAEFSIGWERNLLPAFH